MHHPFVAFCVNEDGQLVITHRRDPQRADPLEMEIDLAELEAKGFDAAARSIGEVALGLLSRWYPQQFALHPALVPPPAPREGRPGE